MTRGPGTPSRPTRDSLRGAADSELQAPAQDAAADPEHPAHHTLWTPQPPAPELAGPASPRPGCYTEAKHGLLPVKPQACHATILLGEPQVRGKVSGHKPINLETAHATHLKDISW